MQSGGGLTQECHFSNLPCWLFHAKWASSSLGLPCCSPLPHHGQGWGAGCPQPAVHATGDQPLLGKGPESVSLPQQ